MTAKEYLSQLWDYDLRFRNRLAAVERIRKDLALIQAVSYGGERVMTSPSGENRVEKIIDRIVDLEASLGEQARQYVMKRQEITLKIEDMQCETKYKELLCLHYVDGLGLYDISSKLRYSYDWTKRVHGEALKIFGEQYGYDTKRHQKTPKNTRP